MTKTTKDSKPMKEHSHCGANGTTALDMLQPIIQDGIILSHNGGVTDSVKNDIDYKYQTEI